MRKAVVQGLILAIGTVVAVQTYGYNKSMYPYELPSGKQGIGLGCEVAKEGMELELGKWYTNFAVCKKYADDHGLPLLAIWSNHSCIHCWYTDVVLVDEKFVQWQKENDAGKVICCFMGGGYDAGPGLTFDQSGSSAYNWMWKGGGKKLDAFPFVVLWWQKGGVNVRTTGDDICKGDSSYALSLTESTIPKRVDNFIAAMESAFKDWKAEAPYAGGYFTVKETEGNRLEAERGTTSVEVELDRAPENAIATNNFINVVSSDGAVLKTIDVSWNDGITNQAVSVDISEVFTESAKDGDKIYIVATDLAGVAKGTNTVTYVDKPTSISNPLWIGERTAETLDWGEWTMDLDVAKAKASSADGGAYTLISVSGSLWCPDCSNAERNFIGVEEDGVNRFNAWASSNKVALAVLDVPSFASEDVTDFIKPTLLSRKPYESTIARAKEYPDSGADPALTNAVLRSGLGYLTRKGVTDEEALVVLERNRKLIQTNTDKGGVHRPEDKGLFGTGVPIFVLLRKDGTVAARLTCFASSSPMASAKEKWDDIIKRFDEMLDIANTEGVRSDNIENNYPGEGAIAFAANGGDSAGEISHCDFVDVFKLEGVGGNALQKVTVKGATDAEVKVTFCKLDSDGKREYVGNSAVGQLSDPNGVSLEHTFTESGEYYVEVTGSSLIDGAFAVDSPEDQNFHSFTISGDVIFVPQEESATGTASQTVNTIVLRLEKDKVYRLQGVDTAALKRDELEPFSEATNCQFFTAKVDGDISVPLLYGNGGSLVYQMWEPGTVGFDLSSMTKNEGVENLDIPVPLSRTGGKSGKVIVSVTLDQENTDLYDSDGKARFKFTDVDIVWQEGENHKTNVVISIPPDERFDGSGNVVLKLKVNEDVNGDTKVVNDTFTLTIKDNDVQAAGKVAFVGAEPFFSKKGTVYVKEGDKATIYASRITGSDGAVSVRVKSDLNDVTFEGAVTDRIIKWGNHRYGATNVVVAGVTAGKTAKISLYDAKDGLKILSASNTVRVVGVAANAPQFKNAAASAVLYRYVASSNSYPIAVDENAEYTKMTFTKLSGTLPAGLKASWDAASNALVISGATTAKAGNYSLVYQVVQVNGSKRIPGLTLELNIAVVDPTAPIVGENGEVVESVFMKARTYKDIPVVDTNGTLKGVLQVTIPPTGRLSAKYTSEKGVMSFSATGWESCEDNSSEGLTLNAVLRSRSFTVEISVKACADGSFEAELKDNESEDKYTAKHSGIMWSRENSADSWKGYYTVALPVESIEESHEGLAPTGAGHVTLKMNTASSINSGRVTWAGMLPNGTAVSGSSVLTRNGEWSRLPIFKCSSTDVVAIGAKILADSAKSEIARAVLADDSISSRWNHKERNPAFNAWYSVGFGVYGGLYRTKDSEGKDFNLAACCNEYYETVNPSLAFYSTVLEEAADETLVLEPVATVVGEKTLSFLDKTSVPSGMTMSLNRTTGIVSGNLKLKVGDGTKTISANWKGVIIQGWGPGCACNPEGDDIIYLPFVTGAYYYTDRMTTEDGKKSLSVRCGGVATIGKPQ